MPVTLCERTEVITGYGSRAWWNHDFDVVAARRDRCVGGCTIVGTVSCYSGDPAVNLIQQRGHLIREGLRNYHAVGGIDGQMEFAPLPA